MRKTLLALFFTFILLTAPALAGVGVVSIFGTNTSNAQSNVSNTGTSNQVLVTTWVTGAATKTIKANTTNAFDVLTFYIYNNTAFMVYELKVNGTAVNGYQANSTGAVTFTRVHYGAAAYGNNQTYTLQPALNQGGYNATWGNIKNLTLWDEFDTSRLRVGVLRNNSILPKSTNCTVSQNDNGSIYTDCTTQQLPVLDSNLNGSVILNYTAHIKAGTFSRDMSAATGSQAVTGIGFRPSAVSFIATNVAAGTIAQFSSGFDSGGTAHYVILDYHNTTANSWIYSSSASIYIDAGSGNYYQGSITTMDTDGFTISWTKGGAMTGTAQIIYMAYR